MTGKPCDTCREDCVGGIIYGNCQKFVTWWKDRSWAAPSDIFSKPPTSVKPV